MDNELALTWMECWKGYLSVGRMEQSSVYSLVYLLDSNLVLETLLDSMNWMGGKKVL